MATLSYDILRSIFEDFEPEEIREDIPVDTIPEDAHRAWRELAFMALVCRAWTLPAQAALYKSVYAMVDVLTTQDAPLKRYRYARFARTMMTTPHLHPFVKHVFINYSRACFMSDTLELNYGWLAMLPEHSLISCRYHSNTGYPPVLDALHAPAIRTVQKLRLATIITPDVLRALAAMTQLEHLDLEAAHWWPEYKAEPVVDSGEDFANAEFPLLTHAALRDRTGCPFYETGASGFVGAVLASPNLVSLTITLSTCFARETRVADLATELARVTPKLRELRIEDMPDGTGPLSHRSMNMVALRQIRPNDPSIIIDLLRPNEFGIVTDFLDTLVLRFRALETLHCLQGTFTWKLFQNLPRTLRELKLDVQHRRLFMHGDALVEWLGDANPKKQKRALASVCLVPSIAEDPLASRVKQACAECGVSYLEV